MNSLKRFLAILNARNMEFLRDHSALAWNILFPVLVVLGFAFAFSDSGKNLFKAGLVGSELSTGAARNLGEVKYVEYVRFDSREEALTRLRRHQLDLVIESTPVPPVTYWVNSDAPKSYLLERIVQGALSGAASPPNSGVAWRRGTVDGTEIRYVDWLISGLLSMNMMFSALFGVGYVIVRYRKNGVLKRLKATPLTAIEFLLAQVASRFLLIAAVTVVVYAGTHAVVHFHMVGSYAALAVVLSLGSICLISLGLLCAARISSEEFEGGLLNLLSWPMMFLSGVWFSLEGAHPWVKRAAQILPLTHVVDAARAIMTEGATLAQVAPNLGVLVGMTVVFLTAGAALFRWE